jgi:hypothetical protein
MKGDLPPDLEAFFLVNTDQGAPELAEAIARLYVQEHPDRSVAIIRALIPRTFIDFNRLPLSPEELAAVGMTPGLMPYIRHPEDQALLRGLHAKYSEAVDVAVKATCGAGGRVLHLHTYAPRSVQIGPIDDNIGATLRAAWVDPQQWPLRPSIDLIGKAVDGARITPESVLTNLRVAFAHNDQEVGDSESYPLHPVTPSFRYASQWPERVFCVEVRRDILMASGTWQPFVEMRPSHNRVMGIASALSVGLQI